MFRLIFDTTSQGGYREELDGTRKECMSRFRKIQDDILENGICSIDELTVTNLNTDEIVCQGYGCEDLDEDDFDDLYDEEED